ncbi:MAG: histidine phosphatase family protein [Pyrinomonadaceae bacterium MAG19_C2-C3]|nr:histidine phosphatase family protein [Pyrinomonadaceae bacterium MAG19_C2-C3]
MKTDLIKGKSSLRLIVLIVLVVIAQVACDRRSEIPTTVIIVRHAEKAVVAGDDPPLSETGIRRAQLLAGVAGEAGVQTIYCSQFRRTRETAEPLAAATGVSINTVAANFDDAPAYAANLAGVITGRHQGQTVLVVGHSNTVPLLIKTLTGKDVPPIRDDEYDNLFILSIPPNATTPPRLVKARYAL